MNNNELQSVIHQAEETVQENYRPVHGLVETRATVC